MEFGRANAAFLAISFQTRRARAARSNPLFLAHLPYLKENISMLWTIAVILLVLWAVGLVTSYTIGGFIHILIVLAIIVILIQIITGRKPTL